MAILRLSSDGKLHKYGYPVGDISTQNERFREYIGNGCDIYERVHPKRLYTEFNCSGVPDRKRPGIAISMLVDEEGRLKDNEINVLASYLYGADIHGQPIVGNVLFVGEKYDEDRELCFCSIDEYEAELLTSKLKMMIALHRDAIERRIPYEGPAYC